MKFASFAINGTPSWVSSMALSRRSRRIFATDIPTKSATLPALWAGAAAGKASRHRLANIKWLPVIPNPDKILCIGLNYKRTA
jgi:2-keto-4-pentenoate hydratase/2-oxohepta-3-ene-1,7-dioic acid hydratase in catechol pathway